MAAPKASPRAVQRVETNTGAVHSFSESEVRAYIEYFNSSLSDDLSLKSVLPLDPANKARFFEVVKDGLLFVKLINKFFPGTVDETKVKPVPKNTFEQSINIDFGLAAAKQIGCSVVNIGASDIQAATEHLVLGLTWQVIKACLMSLVGKNLDASKLLGDDPNLPPEQILLRWFNYHLRNAGHHRSVMNFTSDIQDAENYAVLLGQIASDKVPAADVEKAFREKDFKKRAEMVLGYAERLGCRKFVTAHDIAVEPNPRLNLAFVATLFNAYPALGPTKEELADAKVRELQMKLNAVMAELEEVKLQKKALEGELAQQKANYVALSDQLRTIALKLSDSFTDKNELLKAKAAIEKEMQAAETRSLSLMEQLRVASDERTQLERAAGDSSVLVKNLTAQYEAKLRDLTAERDSLAKMVQEQRIELQQMRQKLMESENGRQQLQMQLDEEKRKREALEKKYREMEEEFARQKRAWEDDRARLLARIKELEEENAMLKARLQEELGHKFNYAQQVREKEEELEKTVEENDNAKSILLARIKQLEEEVSRLREAMASSLDKAAREKEDAMARAKAQKEKELLESELRRYRDLDKVRLLLTGNTKQGWLNKAPKGILAGWKQRYFVLKDNLLYWYEDEKSVTSTKPLGVLPCDEVRLYELDEKEIKKPNTFQLMHETTNYEITLSAAKADDMKDWITEIRLAKKKKLGVTAAARDTADQRKAREGGGPAPLSPRTSMAPRSASPQRK